MSAVGGDGPHLAEIEDLASVGVWEWEVARNHLWWSPGLYRLLDIAPDETPSFERWIDRVHPDDLSTVKTQFTRARRDAGVHVMEYRVARPTGEIRTLLARATATLGDGGMRIVGIDQDITQTKETAARVVFSDRMVAIGTLANGVAHEINNPLAIIAANLQLLEERHDVSLIEESRRALDRIRTIVRGLTAFSRSTEDRRRPIDAVKILELAILLTGSQLRHRARLVKQLDPVPRVNADEARLGQVFINLLVNAAEAIPDGGTNGHEISVSSRTDAAGWAIVEISDTGPGIATDVAARIFDPFFTTKPVGQGTGLGLSICHGIVRSLGGEITFRTTRGKGTTFVVALPPSVEPPARPRSASPMPPLARRGTILVIDDEVLFANSLKRLLSGEHDVHVVSNGRDALARIRAEKFDAILCDLMMPEMTGAELYAELTPEQTRRIIFITGGAFSPASQVFLDRVPNQRFEKPCDIGLLRAAVRALVDSA